MIILTPGPGIVSNESPSAEPGEKPRNILELQAEELSVSTDKHSSK